MQSTSTAHHRHNNAADNYSYSSSAAAAKTFNFGLTQQNTGFSPGIATGRVPQNLTFWDC